MAFPFIYQSKIIISKNALSLEEAKDIVIDYLETKGCNGDITDNAIYFRNFLRGRINRFATGEVFFNEMPNHVTIRVRTKNYFAFSLYIVIGCLFPVFIAFPRFSEGWLTFTLACMLLMFLSCAISHFPSSIIFACGMKRKLNKFKKQR